MASTSSSLPSTVEEIFQDYSGRRGGIIRALTHDVDKFFGMCDPAYESLCLYGYPNGSWEVALPEEKVLPVFPEPVIGINFGRDSMDRKQWLMLRPVDGELKRVAEVAEESIKEDEDEQDTQCGSCGANYNVTEFWIGCDVCDKWYHGECVKITPAEADSIEQYECPYCITKRTQP